MSGTKSRKLRLLKFTPKAKPTTATFEAATYEAAAELRRLAPDFARLIENSALIYLARPQAIGLLLSMTEKMLERRDLEENGGA